MKLNWPLEYLENMNYFLLVKLSCQFALRNSYAFNYNVNNNEIEVCGIGVTISRHAEIPLTNILLLLSTSNPI